MNPQDTDLDIEPEEPDLLAPLDEPLLPVDDNVVPFPGTEGRALSVPEKTTELPPITAMLPSDFPLMTLLQFLPDVRLKRAADTLAQEALAIDVTTETGLAAADAAMDRLRKKVAEIGKCFEYPVELANKLHKRLTGLRTDFTLEASTALDTLGRRVVIENRRREAIAAEVRRKAQEEADRKAREDAERAAQAAKKANAPAAVVTKLEEAAKSATAPPVGNQTAGHGLASTSVVQKWRARLRGTAAEAEANPKVADMTTVQRESLQRLCAAIGRGEEPLTAIEPNWSYLNKRAGAEKSAFAVTGLEAFDEGGTRKKGGR